MLAEPGGLYESGWFEGFTGESESVCYHAVRYASTGAILVTALQPDLSRLGVAGAEAVGNNDALTCPSDIRLGTALGSGQ